MDSVVIFREGLLPLSETFIRSQVNNMERYRGVYAGCRRVVGLDLSDREVLVLEGPGAKLEALILKTTGYSPRLLGRLRKYEPVLVHAHFGQDGATALPLARKLKVPLLVTFHGSDANLSDGVFQASRSGRRYLRRRDQLKQGASGFIAVSKFIAARLVAQGFPDEKIQVHYIGVDVNWFQPERPEGGEKIVLFVGRLVEKKGCEYLIRAMEAVQAEMGDAELVVIGDGPLRGNLEVQAKESLRRFRFMGAQSSNEIRDWMKRSTVLCTPSIVAESGDAEGLPIVILEAQASGLPVAAFASAGIPEAVIDGDNGFLAPEKDWRLLAQKLAKLLADADLRQAFRIAGRKRVETMFDLKQQTRKLEDIYEASISKKEYAK